MLHRVAAASLALTILSGCGDDVAGKGRRIGLLNAGVDLPDYPAECRAAVPHAPLAEGAELLSLLRRERAQLQKANRQQTACAAFYDSVVAEFERGPRKGDPLPDEISR